MNWATPYESASRCTGTARPGARALLAWALEVYRDRGAYSLGIYNCRTVRGGSTTSLHGEGRAVDLGLPLGPDGRGTPLGRAIVAQLGAHGARLGVQAIVYDRTVWSAKSPAGRPYGGTHPHYDHLHIELTRQAADRLTLATFRAVLGTAAEEDDMPVTAPDDVRYYQRILAGTYPKPHHQAGPPYDLGTSGPAGDGVDGVLGERTEAAIRDWQTRRGIEVTGTLTLTTCMTLQSHANRAHATAEARRLAS